MHPQDPAVGAAPASAAPVAGPTGPSLGAAASDELSDVLGAIGAFVELLRPEVGDLPGARTTVDQLLRTVYRAQGLIRQARDFAGLHEARQQRRPVQPAALVQGIVGIAREVLRPELRLQVIPPPELPPVLADPHQFHELVMGLILHAACALRPGAGTVTVRLRRVDADVQLTARHPGLRLGPCVCLEISHQADPSPPPRGQPPRSAPAEPTEPSLAEACLKAARMAVQGHRGAMGIEVLEGGGGGVTVYLPAHLHGLPEDQLVPGGMPRGHGERILFVDDDAAQRQAAAEVLRRLGYTPVVHPDAEAALAAFRAEPAAVEVAMLDLNMPRMTGVDLATQLLEIRGDLPVYLVTGLTGAWTPEMAHNLGIRGVLMKPLTPVMWCLTLYEALSKVPAPRAEA